MQFRNEDLAPLAEIISQLSGIPPERLAGFAVVLAVWEEDGRPGGRLISSTGSLRNVAQMLEFARDEVGKELEKLAGMS